MSEWDTESSSRLEEIISEIRDIADSRVEELSDEIHKLNGEIHRLNQNLSDMKRDNDVLREVAAGKVINTTGESIKIGNTRYHNGSKL
jgi:TolA-binding protein